MEYIKKYWLYALVSLQFVLLIGFMWYTQGQLARHETALINIANIAAQDNTTLKQVVDFLKQVSQPK